MIKILIDKTPMEYHIAKRMATSKYGNLNPQAGCLDIVSPMKNAFTKALPPATCMIDVLAEYVENLVIMWELADRESHFSNIKLQDCEPFGILIGLSGHYLSVWVVIPTVEFFMQTEEKLGQAIGMLTREVCSRCAYITEA